MHLGIELANKKGQNVALVFSKLQEGSKSKHSSYRSLKPDARRIQFSESPGSPDTFRVSPKDAKREGSTSPGGPGECSRPRGALSKEPRAW